MVLPDIPELSHDDKQKLLRIAREAVEAHILGRHPPERQSVRARAGAFVTLTCHGELRGCIGHPESDQPLEAVVARCAVAACCDDPRFSPLTQAELQGVRIEISVLGRMHRVTDILEIVVGRDGLLVQEGPWRGLLLPQVASERRWGRETFLSQTCIKAGLARNAWERGAEIFRFQAQVFGEPEPEPA
jgi:uncharacterized protein